MHQPRWHRDLPGPTISIAGDILLFLGCEGDNRDRWRAFRGLLSRSSIEWKEVGFLGYDDNAKWDHRIT